MKKTLTLLAVMLMPLAAPLLFAADAGEGKAIFESQCAMCHQLPEPGMLKINQWRLVLGVMQSRYRENGMEPLSEEELGHVVEYLKEKARK